MSLWRPKSRSPYRHVADDRMLCRPVTRHCRTCLPILLSPESRSGSSGPKKVFGLLAFGLGLLNPAIHDNNYPKTSCRFIRGVPLPQKGNPTVCRDTHHRVASSAATITDLAQEIVPQNANNGVPPNNDASQAIVQCLLIAAWRGRQIRLARERAADRVCHHS